VIKTLILVLLCAAAPAFTQDKPVDISGAWGFEIQIGGGTTGTPTVTFKQDGEKLTGTYTGAFGSGIKLTGTVKGGEVAFSFSGEAQGQSAEVVYKGKIVNKDSMQGTVALAGLGEGTWTGKRQ
jgi:hypothetical protein